MDLKYFMSAYNGYHTYHAHTLAIFLCNYVVGVVGMKGLMFASCGRHCSCGRCGRCGRYFYKVNNGNK
jgi:hypothetical protein